jgi:hypothetical protein
MNLRQAEKVAIRNASSYHNGVTLSGGARWKCVGIFPAKDYGSVFLKHTKSSPVSRPTLNSGGRNCKSIVLDRIGKFHCAPLLEANPSTTITPGSCLTCERCHGFGYEATVAGKVAFGGA